MSVQINIRVDDEMAGALEHLAAEEGTTRGDLVRQALVRRLQEAAKERVEASYERAYAKDPETPDELRRAEEAAARLVEDEPWERWW